MAHSSAHPFVLKVVCYHVVFIVVFESMQQTELSMIVRDYECDTQGIVNNAVYQNYLEHARHKWLQAQGIDFNQCTKEGLRLVVVRAEIDYKKPLFPGEQFIISTRAEKLSPVRMLFMQFIRRNDSLCVQAHIYATGVNSSGRFCLPVFDADASGRHKDHKASTNSR